MKTYEQILLDHYKKYPLMQIEDFIKLSFQMIFGPKHFSSNPTLTRVKEMIEKEMQEVVKESKQISIENIGQTFCRIYLTTNQNQKDLEKIAQVFYESMIEPLFELNQKESLFKSILDTVIHLIKDEKINLNYNESILMMNTYKNQGIRPISHSEMYRNAYQPHYRVVNCSKIK